MTRPIASRTAPALPALTGLGPLVLVGLALLGGCGSSSTSTTGAASAPAVSSGASAGGASRAASAGGASTGEASSGASTPAASPGAVGKASALPTPAGPLKKATTARLPEKLGGYTGRVVGAGASTTNGMYTGPSADQMLMVALVRGREAGVFSSRLAGAHVEGHAVCGKQQGVATCVIPLQGGYISVVGTDRDAVAAVGTLSNTLWAALA